MTPKNAKKTEVKKVIVKANESTRPVLGYVIWYTIHEMERTAVELTTALESSIGKSFMPSEPSKRKALRNTLEAIEAAGLITRVRDDDQVVAFTLHEQVLDKENIDVTLTKLNTLVYDKKAGKLDIRKATKKVEIMALFEKYQAIYTEQDVRRIVGQYLDANGGITVRENGGIYFVKTAAVRDKLKRFLESLNCKLSYLGVPDDEAEKATLHEVIQNELQRDLQLAQEDAKQLIMKEGAKVGSYENRLEKFKVIRAKVEMYSDLLKADAEELTGTIEALNTELRQALAGELEEYPQMKLFPYQSRVTYSGKAKEKYGTEGTVVGYGYWVDPDGKNSERVKVLFDFSKRVENISPTRLQLAVIPVQEAVTK